MVDKATFLQSWVLVTGASSGIGEEFCKQLAHGGSNLILVARSADKLERFAADLRRINGIQVHTIAADLSRAEGVATVFHSTDALGITPDHLINNAGFGSVGPFHTTDPERQTDMVRLNVEAVVALSHHYLGAMVQRRNGGIINIASAAAFQPVPLMTTYAATKAFVLSFSLALAEEVADYGVRILASCPGPVPTGFQAAAGIEASRASRWAELEPRVVVARTLEAYGDNERVYTPGILNSTQSTLAKLLPNSVVVPVARHVMRKLGRD